MSQILSHPFMTMQSFPQETRLRHSSGRVFVPSSLGSLDSGHATMSSSNHTLSHHGSGGGPLRATLRPKGLPLHPAPPPQPLPSNDSSSNATRSTSSANQSRPEQHYQKQEEPNGFLYRRANSLGALNRQDNNSRQDDAWSYHSQPVERRKSHSHQERGKENPSIPTKVELSVRGNRQPFQDKTNRQALNLTSAPSKPKLPSSVAAGRSTPHTEKQRKVESLQDLVPPLNATRLHPSQHETRGEVVSVRIEVTIIL